MKKIILVKVAICAILVSIMAGVQVIEVVDANPFFMYHLIDPVPGSIPPVITVNSPLNNTVYSSDEITVSFNVSKPQLDNRGSSIIDITYTLDNETVQAFTIWKENPGGGVSASSDSGIPKFNTSFTLSALSSGNHSLMVEAEGVVFAGGESGLDIFFMNSTSPIFFTVAAPPSLQPSPTPNQSIDSDYLHNPTFLIEIVSVIVVVAIATLSFVYFRRHNKRSELRAQG
jgi:hypothetical protein